MIRGILVNLPMGRDSNVARDYAISLAEEFDARLTGVGFFYEPIYPYIEGVPSSFLEEQRAQAESAAKKVKADFIKLTGDLSSECHTMNATVSGASDLFARMARRHDISVVEQAGEDTSEYDNFIEAALFESGRPVIVVPYIHKGRASFNNILISWDGSAPAARAVSDAMPFLHKAKKIEIITVAEAGKITEDIPGAEIASHLARHGLRVEVKRVDTEEVDVGNTILSYAADVSAEMLVMGAYGHSRLLEFVLGGVTAEILASMTVPVLMSH